MKTLILGLVATAALATATAASACHGGKHDGRRADARTNASFVAFKNGTEHGLKLGFFARRGGSYSKLSGTGTDFNGTNPSATGSIVAGNHNGGHFTLGLNTVWSSAQTKTWTDNDGDRDDGTYTVSCAPSTATLTLSNGSTSTYTLAGKTCSVTKDGVTKYGFGGASSDGTKAFFKEDGSTVTGVVFSGLAVNNGLFIRFGRKH
jgi:hypothetical protein